MNKLLVTAISLVVLLVVVQSYDFDDAMYNQILARELYDLDFDESDSLVHQRNRRDEEAVNDDKCHRRRFRSCCDEEVFHNLHEEDKALKKECFKQITGSDKYGSPDPFRCDKTEKHKRDYGCICQCVGQKKGVIDTDGNIIEVELKKQLEEKLGSREWLKPHLDEFVTKCLAQAKEAAAKPKSEDKESCNPSAMKFGHCIWKEIQLKCPADQIKDDKRCNKIREDLKNSSDFPSIRPVYDK